MSRLHLLLILGALSFQACKGQKIVSTELARPGGSVKVIKRDVVGTNACVLTLAFFSDADCSIRIVSQTSRQEAAFLSEVAVSTDAFAACNGGYFDPGKMLPSALEIADGRRSGAYGPTGGGDGGGVLVVRSGKLAIWPQNAFQPTNEDMQLVQCSPLLIKQGVPFEHPGDEPRVARTFIMTDGNGKWAIGTCDRSGLSELAKMISNPKIIPEFKVKEALNLDGGPSTGMWWRETHDKAATIREKWHVRNFVFVVPRK